MATPHRFKDAIRKGVVMQSTPHTAFTGGIDDEPLVKKSSETARMNADMKAAAKAAEDARWARAVELSNITGKRVRDFL